MFRIMERYKADRYVLKSGYICCIPKSKNNVGSPNSQFFIKIQRQDSAFSLKGSNLELEFETIHIVGNHDDHEKTDDKRLVNLAQIALYSEHKMTTSSGKDLGRIDYAHVMSLLSKLLTSNKDSYDLSIGIDESNQKRKQE